MFSCRDISRCSAAFAGPQKKQTSTETPVQGGFDQVISCSLHSIIAVNAIMVVVINNQQTGTKSLFTAGVYFFGKNKENFFKLWISQIYFGDKPPIAVENHLYYLSITKRFKKFF
ncbi:hypothetical protein BC349_07140 [Flavihumibacter stibioxidans]|uniref:Uncharacterized protein n=1 Tax=Flavihumibacter stibioxidans TaxID=1834163 RepID=A0ABR7M768_9BACT|nr:hypothetical protein [Flavihumibacter stibioxidans]